MTPDLLTLSIEVTVSGRGPGMPNLTYVRRFDLSTAPSLFLFACGEPWCEGGGHDLSTGVLKALRARCPELRGESFCSGKVDGLPCTRRLQFRMTATFKDVHCKRSVDIQDSPCSG